MAASLAYARHSRAGFGRAQVVMICPSVPEILLLQRHLAPSDFGVQRVTANGKAWICLTVIDQ
jgi:hypothetical protein